MAQERNSGGRHFYGENGRGFTIPADRTPVLATPLDHVAGWNEIYKRSRIIAASWSMYLQAGPAVQEIVDALRQASRNGAKTYLAFDRISGLVFNETALMANPLGFDPRLERRNRDRDAMIATHPDLTVIELKHGGVFKSFFPSQGTDHRKGDLSDYEFASMPMFNKVQGSIAQNVDGGVTFSDAPTVDAYHKMFFEIISGTENPDDYTIVLNQGREMVVDTGRRFHSKIQKRIDDLIDRAEDNLVFMGQFSPDLLTAYKIKKRAKKGVKVDNYTSSKEEIRKHRGIKARAHALYENSMKNEPNHTRHTHPTRYVHPKVFLRDIVLDDANNVISGEGIITTHNGVRYTELFGTAEVAFVTTEPKFLSQMWWFAQDFYYQPRTIKNHMMESQTQSGIIVPSYIRPGMAAE